jgi:hypothetical protein
MDGGTADRFHGTPHGTPGRGGARRDRRDDKGESGPRFSAAPTALRLSSGLIPSPSGLGCVWRSALRASHPWRFCSVIFFHVPQASRRAPTASSRQAGTGGMTKGRVDFQLELVHGTPHGTPGQAGQVAGIPGLKRETWGTLRFYL